MDRRIRMIVDTNVEKFVDVLSAFIEKFEPEDYTLHYSTTYQPNLVIHCVLVEVHKE